MPETLLLLLRRHTLLHELLLGGQHVIELFQLTAHLGSVQCVRLGVDIIVLVVWLQSTQTITNW